MDLVKAGSLLFQSNKSNSLAEQHFCLKLQNLLYASVCRPEMRGATPLEQANSTAPLPVAIIARKRIYWSSFCTEESILQSFTQTDTCKH